MTLDATGIDEAFAAKNLPDLGHDMKDLKVFSWTLKNWKKLEKKLTSPEFECGGHRWFVFTILRLRSLVIPPLTAPCAQADTTISIR